LLLQQILIPQIASWFAMWVSGLIICYGLLKKEQLRARLAAAGQVGDRLWLHALTAAADSSAHHYQLPLDSLFAASHKPSC
jgi:hypothetical protein